MAVHSPLSNCGRQGHRGEIKLSSFYKPSVSTLVVTLQFGADSISWYFALKDCWTDAGLLPGQEELLYDSELLPAQEELYCGTAGSTAVEHDIVSQGLVPEQTDDPVDPPSIPGAPGGTHLVYSFILQMHFTRPQAIHPYSSVLLGRSRNNENKRVQKTKRQSQHPNIKHFAQPLGFTTSQQTHGCTDF